jgi:DNA polymerase-3 subunit epsilon
LAKLTYFHEYPQLLDGQTVVVVDVETTGLYPSYGDRVCEIGIVRARGDEILETYQSLVNPQRPISPGASRVNGLRDEDVCQAPLFVEIADQVLDRINGNMLVCHNAPFDLGFLEAEFSRLGRPWQPAGVIDTLEIARRFFDFDSNSLPALADVLGIETPQAHRALGDALTTLQVFQRFYRRLVRRGSLQVGELVGSYLPASLRMPEGYLPPSIQKALAENKAVEITYIDAHGNETCRLITPLHVLAANDVVYLVAYCHLRQAERNFRLDRIIAVADLG